MTSGRVTVVAALDAVAGGGAGGAQGGGGGVEVAADVDLVAAGADQVGSEDLAARVADVAQAHGGAQGLAPGARGDLADGYAVAKDELAAPDHGVGVCQDQGDQPAAGGVGAGPLCGVAAGGGGG